MDRPFPSFLLSLHMYLHLLYTYSKSVFFCSFSSMLSKIIIALFKRQIPNIWVVKIFFFLHALSFHPINSLSSVFSCLSEDTWDTEKLLTCPRSHTEYIEDWRLFSINPVSSCPGIIGICPLEMCFRSRYSSIDSTCRGQIEWKQISPVLDNKVYVSYTIQETFILAPGWTCQTWKLSQLAVPQ